MTSAAPTAALRKAPRPFALVWVLILAAGCGGEIRELDAGGRVSVTATADQPVPSSPTLPDQVTIGCEAAPDLVVPEASGTVGDPAEEGFEVIGEDAQSVQPGGSATFAVRFEGAPAAVLWVVPGGEGISPSLEGAEFRREELFGAAMAVAALASPRDGSLVVRNETSRAEDIAVIVLGRTGRRLSIEGSPSEAAPNESVSVTVRLTEPTDADRPCAAVLRDGVIVARLALQQNGAGIWRSAFRPEVAGEYGLVAWVGGDRPRRAEMSFLLVRADPKPQYEAPRGSGFRGD